MTALHFAAQNNNFDVVQLLVEHGADINMSTNVSVYIAHTNISIGWDMMHHINPYENLPISNIGSLDLSSPVINGLRPDQYSDYIEDEITHHITSGLDLKIILLKTS